MILPYSKKFIGLIDWRLLQKYTVKLNTDFKKNKFFTHEHLASMIYFHICEHDGLRDLKQSMTEQMSEILPDISLATLVHLILLDKYRNYLFESVKDILEV
ncbi:DUF4372 domain-containing protein [Cellulosilyticum ruminicola]|uniref:DUF4372 domain-containing protein n=1 Tax=Cellulosilyticum ruminicola TaxID=425254 RepID=UPI0012EE9C08|nr:DUF4372 domain-containing protein [Cellulosilyticum ruminicola]